MANFAHVGYGGVIDQIVVAEQDYIDEGNLGDPAGWLRYEYDDFYRGRPAVLGGTYDAEHDCFVDPKPYTSWVLDHDTHNWTAPVPYPTDGLQYRWDEATLSWDGPLG